MNFTVSRRDLARILVGTVLTLFIGGCGEIGTEGLANQRAVASGSPFRVEAADGGYAKKLMELPLGHTRADATLRHDVLEQIIRAETGEAQKWQGDEPAEVRLMPDGREVWIFPDASDSRIGVAFVITFRASPQGGTDAHLEGPTRFFR